MRLAALLFMLPMAACAITPADLQALSGDKNSDCITETSIWVTLVFERNGGCHDHYPPPGFMLVPVTPAKAP